MIAVTHGVIVKWAVLGKELARFRVTVTGCGSGVNLVRKPEVMALPLADRVALAEALWESIDADAAARVAKEEREAIAEARRRDDELTAGKGELPSDRA